VSETLPNVIFLDIDGVLCTPRACTGMRSTGIQSYLDPVACMLVSRLCEENNAKIVMSSMWRDMFAKDAMEAILNAACPNLGDYIWQNHVWWKTRSWVYSDEDGKTSDRGREIQHWIENNIDRFNNFVVLDDMADMRPVQDSLVRCDVYDGMGFKQWQAADEMLKAFP